MKKQSFKSKFRPDFPADYHFDYKDAHTLGKFVIEGGKIVPSRISKLSSGQQRAVTAAIKRARNLALLPVGSDAYDRGAFVDPISPQPFKFE